jgi:hypothetical protein
MNFVMEFGEGELGGFVGISIYFSTHGVSFLRNAFCITKLVIATLSLIWYVFYGLHDVVRQKVG